MEVNLQQRRKGLQTKIPDIQQTLTVVQFLQNRRKKSMGEKVDEEVLSDDEDEDLDDDDDDELEEGDGKKVEPLKTLFELNDTLYAEAEVEETGQVGIWLGVSDLHSSLLITINSSRQIRCDESESSHSRQTQCYSTPLRKPSLCSVGNYQPPKGIWKRLLKIWNG